MILKQNNFAYIDGANLHMGVRHSGWRLDNRKFRILLREKYSVERAYLFLGLIPRYKDLYKTLQEAGFTLVFKETIYDGEGKVKGNCDADLVLWAVRDAYENSCDKAVIVSSDGDFAGLVSFLVEKKKFRIALSPYTSDKCSILLKRTNAPIAYLDDFRLRLEAINEKAPNTDGTVPGSFS